MNEMNNPLPQTLPFPCNLISYQISKVEASGFFMIFIFSLKYYKKPDFLNKMVRKNVFFAAKSKMAWLKISEALRK